MNEFLYVALVANGPCKCQTMLPCAMQSVDATINTWGELVSLLKSYPCMRVCRVEVRER